MITAKTLAGEMITLEVESVEEFCEEYRKLLSDEIRPFSQVKVESDEKENYVLVDLLDIPKQIYDLIHIKSMQQALSRNTNIKALDFLVLKDITIDLYNHCHALAYIKKTKRKYSLYMKWVVYAINHPDAFSAIKSGCDQMNWRSSSRLWMYLLRNPNIQKEWIEYIQSHPITIDNSHPGWESEYDLEIQDCDWRRFNTLPQLVPFFEEHPEYIKWNEMSENPAAYHLLEKNLDRVNVKNLCSNPNEDVIQLLNRFDEKKLDLARLSRNPAAIHLLRDRLKLKKRICMNEFAKNPAAVEDMIKFMSHPKLSQSYYYHLLKQMIVNPNAGKFILDHVENQLFSVCDLILIAEQPYLFR